MVQEKPAQYYCYLHSGVCPKSMGYPTARAIDIYHPPHTPIPTCTFRSATRRLLVRQFTAQIVFSISEATHRPPKRVPGRDAIPLRKFCDLERLIYTLNSAKPKATGRVPSKLEARSIDYSGRAIAYLDPERFDGTNG